MTFQRTIPGTRKPPSYNVPLPFLKPPLLLKKIESVPPNLRVRRAADRYPN